MKYFDGMGRDVTEEILELKRKVEELEKVKVEKPKIELLTLGGEDRNVNYDGQKQSDNSEQG